MDTDILGFETVNPISPPKFIRVYLCASVDKFSFLLSWRSENINFLRTFCGIDTGNYNV
jgi:hypothetical protein